MDRPLAARRILVVGGGLAGLAAAARLRSLGAEAMVLEAAPAAGGRAAGDRDLDPQPLVASGLDRGLSDLLAETDLADRFLPLRPVAIAQLHAGRLVPVDRGGGAGAGRPPGLGLRDRARLRRMPRLLLRFADLLDAGAPERATRLDDRSVDDWSRLYFGRAVRDRMAAPRVAAELLQDPAETSRVLLMLELLRREVAPRGVLRAGAAELAEALGGGHVRTGARVGAVASEGDAVRVEAGDEALQADAVVLATRADVAAALLGGALAHAERDYLAAVRYAPTACLSVELERTAVREATLVRVPPCEPGPLASLLVEPGGLRSRVAEGGAQAWVVARGRTAREQAGAPDESVAKDLLGALQRLFPGASSAARRTRLVRHDAGVVRFEVGAFRRIAAFRRVQADLRACGRRVYFAGDHLVAPSAEGAITSGLRAAGEIASDLA